MFRINANARRADGQRFKFWDALSIRSHEVPTGDTCVHVVLKNRKELTFFGEILSVVSAAAPSSSRCCGCGVMHRTRNNCDNSFSAFCTDECYNSTMTDIVDAEEEERKNSIPSF
jgi:hypothetical protein